jgi:hypothetical protein
LNYLHFALCSKFERLKDTPAAQRVSGISCDSKDFERMRASGGQNSRPAISAGKTRPRGWLAIREQALTHALSLQPPWKHLQLTEVANALQLTPGGTILQ